MVAGTGARRTEGGGTDLVGGEGPDQRTGARQREGRGGLEEKVGGCLQVLLLARGPQLQQSVLAVLVILLEGLLRMVAG